MCSLYSLLRMENYQGDLTDIVRASATGAYGVSEQLISSSDSWQFAASSSSSSDPINFSSSMEDQPRDNYFGDPFSHLRDPLLHELGLPAPGFFSSPSSSEMISCSSGVVADETGACTFGGASSSGSGSGMLAQSIVDDDMKRPATTATAVSASNIFSRMLQISPSAKLPASQCDSPAAAAAAMAAATTSSPRGINANSSSKGCLVDNTAVQISSPRNPGIKRRKSQVKQVVCIPAPVAPNSRPSGEVVPSDLWAWRKYGQKPIKGSPYPRGYYRCSSSKGCSARKQVERSRADPNMLVITYTSEHNHPWPTQRNALAGSTRSQPLKNNASSKSSPAAGSHQLQKTSATSPKEEQRDINDNNNNNIASPIVTAGSNSTTSASIKEEIEDMEKQLEMVDDGEFSTDHHHHHHQGFPYRPSMPPDSNHSEQDFFADLGEIEADPLNLLFSQGFGADHEQKGSKGLDPFNLFDWSADNNNNNNNSAFGEAKRGL